MQSVHRKRGNENHAKLSTALLEWSEDVSVAPGKKGRFVYCTILLKGAKGDVETHFKRALKLRTDEKDKYQSFHGLSEYAVGIWVVEQQGEECQLRFLAWHPDAEGLTERTERTMLEVFLPRFDVRDFSSEYVVTDESTDSGANDVPLRVLLKKLTEPVGPLLDWFELRTGDDPDEHENQVRTQIADAVSRLKGQESIHTFGLDFEESKPGKPVLFIDQTTNIFADEEHDEVICHHDPLNEDGAQQVIRRTFDPQRFETYFSACDATVDFNEKQSLLGAYTGIKHENQIADKLDNLIEFDEFTKAKAHEISAHTAISNEPRPSINPLLLLNPKVLKGENISNEYS